MTFSPPYSITSAENEALGTGFRDTGKVEKTLTTSFVHHLKGRNTGNNIVPVDRSVRDKTTLTEGSGSYTVEIAETAAGGHVSIRVRSLAPKGRNPIFDLVENERHHVPMIGGPRRIVPWRWSVGWRMEMIA